MTTHIVLGLAFGDEGKGVTTDYLCRQAERPLVIRFSGGHQAGHTVVSPQGRRHVFSNFGAGTLAGAPTFWSKYCTFHPVGYANEHESLLAV
ncbi:MAG: adenylosuccinate synthetase, partial [Bacteroidota bacterium]